MSIGRKKILWVDDEIEFYRSQILFLETRGYSVVPVFNNCEVVNLLRSNTKCCDLILIDEKVGGIDSLITIDEIKKINPNLPVIIITQNNFEQLNKIASKRKIDAILTHPVNIDQFLMFCKKLLNPSLNAPKKGNENFIRSYSEIKKILAGNYDVIDFFKIYEKLVYWDLQLDVAGDEAFRQAFAGLKYETNLAFSNFLINNYGQWINGVEAPLLGHKLIQKEILPLLSENKCVLFLLSGMRLDQYLSIETALGDLFKSKRLLFVSNLPSSEEFSRKAFLAGELPRDIDSKYFDFEDKNVDCCFLENKLLLQMLSKNGIPVSEQDQYILHIDHTANEQSILSQIDACSDSKLICIVVDIDSHILHSNSIKLNTNGYLTDDKNFRSFSEKWFQGSAIFKVIQKLSSRNVTVAVSSDHGSLLCSRGTDIYNTKDLLKNRRYIIGKDISADERRVLFLSDPTHFGLPTFEKNINCIIAKENFYFSHPEKYEFYLKEYQSNFQKGGISLEEMIMPLGIFKGK